MFFYSSLENPSGCFISCCCYSCCCHANPSIRTMPCFTRFAVDENDSSYFRIEPTTADRKNKIRMQDKCKATFFLFRCFFDSISISSSSPQQQQKLFNESNKKGFYFEKDFGQNSSDEKNIKQNIFDQKTRKSGDCMMPS